MKFRTEQDKILFLVECDQPVPASLDLQNWEPDEEMQGLFIKKRADIVPKLKSFRRSQATKAQWRRDRYKLMQGIGTFHQSTAGKRFHRNMGRFLALRDFGNSSLFAQARGENEALQGPGPMSFEDRGSFLKALSSIKTHLYVESEYYNTLSSQVELDLLIEEVIDTFDRIERAVIMFGEVLFDDFDLLTYVVEDDSILRGLVERSGKTRDEVDKIWNRTVNFVEREYGLQRDDNGFSAMVLQVAKEMVGVDKQNQ